MTNLESEWFSESKYKMNGWNFSHLEGRWSNEQLPWSFSALVDQYLNDDDAWLDIDTGGGELMKSFHHPIEKTVVTEGWGPNIRLLKSRFNQQGLKIYPDPKEILQNVPKRHFNVVTNSHGALPFDQIRNVLKPDGVFITQQVGAVNNFSLSRFFDKNYIPAYPENTLIQVVSDLQHRDFEILKADATMAKMNFFDVGAIVYYATMIPWEFPDFDVEQALPKLHQLQKMIDNAGRVTTFEDRFVVVAKKITKTNEL